MTTEFSDVREALKAVIPATGDHGGAVSVHIGYTDPGESPDRRLMDTIVTDGQDGCCVGIKLGSLLTDAERDGSRSAVDRKARRRL